jgi:anti-sigma regulatory factor (Ser/Thr protein kinase)
MMRELTASFELPFGVEAPRVARDAVGSVLWGWGFRDPDWLAAVSVVVSELVSNAVVHGGGCLALDLRADGDRVTIGAVDGSAVVPRRIEPGVSSRGRGLALVEALSRRWGVVEHTYGKRVFVDLLPPRGTPA